MAVVLGATATGRITVCALALTGALLAAGAGLRAAEAAGTRDARVVPIQYYQQPYGGGYDRDRDRYGRDRYDRDRSEGDRYGRDRYEPRREESYGRGGGGRGVGGSFQQTCTDVRQSGSTLTAVCGDGRGNQYRSAIDVNRCGGQDIANVAGFLRCGNVQGNGMGRVR